ncbi:hypothetical protein ACIRSU_14960 [Streptomyces sp. NPDC101160]|uniref:hypothetical protein n=1 Tax=Streptomyces sp. NPDC101160 TaxID=3366118 RepID=UPI00380D6139
MRQLTGQDHSGGAGERDNLNELIAVAEAEHGPVTDEEIQSLRDQLTQTRREQARRGASAA